LHKLARAVCERFEGDLPRDPALLRELPGVGPYTARAIAAFAFNEDAVAVDTNVRRIVHRTQLGLEWPPRAGPAEVDALAAALLPAGRAFAFNSALMDLGATICGARAPKCLLCPLRELCAAAPIDARELAAAAGEHAPAATAGKRVRFEATSRYVRGRVVDRLRELPAGRRVSFLDLAAGLSGELPHHDAAALESIVAALAREGVIERTERGLRLAR
jgi:A/G-specific adenine glycosylase